MPDLAKYDDFWAAFFGLDARQLRTAGVNVVRHARLAGYAGLWFFVHGVCVVVSAPDDLLERLESQKERIGAEPLPGAARIRELLGREPDRVIGPVYQGWLPQGAFRPVHDPNVRRLTSSDEAELQALRLACTSEEWEHSALGSASEPRFGYFAGGRLLAAAGTDLSDEGAAGPGALCHPDHRGRGHGIAVISPVVEHALAAGKLPLYQTLLHNTAAVAIARRLGYEQYATHLAVRITA